MNCNTYSFIYNSRINSFISIIFGHNMNLHLKKQKRITLNDNYSYITSDKVIRFNRNMIIKKQNIISLEIVKDKFDTSNRVNVRKIIALLNNDIKKYSRNPYKFKNDYPELFI